MAKNMTPLSPDEMLGQLTDNISVAFKIFDEKVGKNRDKAVYCFVEGYDMPYYSPRIEPLTDKEAEFIDCGGKKGVTAIHTYLTSKPAYRQFKTLFFVDKDYDDNQGLSSDIFITDGYSVENYYASDKAVRKALKGICNVKANEEKDLDKVMEWYQVWKSEFFNATRLFCGWYAATKNRPDRRIADKKYKKSFPSRYASISSKGISTVKYTVDNLNNDYAIDSPVSQEEADAKLSDILSLDHIRGKYVIQLVESFIEAVRLDAISPKSYNSREFDFHKNIKTILARLSFAADTSDGLKTYLRNRL